LEGSTEIIEQLEMGDAVSGVPTVEGGEKSSVEPPKGVEAYDRDKDPEVASDDSEAAGEQQTEVAQESSTHGFEGVAPAQAEEQDTPTGVCPFLFLWPVSLFSYIRLKPQGYIT